MSVEDDFEGGFAKMTQDGVDGCVVLSSPQMSPARAPSRTRPSAPPAEHVRDEVNVLAGGLMSYAPVLSISTGEPRPTWTGF